MTDTRPWERGDEREPWDVDMPQGEIVELAVERAVTAWLDRNVDRLADAIAERVQPVDTLRAQVVELIERSGPLYESDIAAHFLPTAEYRPWAPPTPLGRRLEEVLDQLEAECAWDDDVRRHLGRRPHPGALLCERDENGVRLFSTCSGEPPAPASPGAAIRLDAPANLDEVFIMGRSGSSGWFERVLGWTARNGKIEPLVDGAAWGIEGLTTVPHEGETDWSIYTGETP